MRLIGEVTEESRAYAFYSLLSKRGIESSYELCVSPKTQKKAFYIWVYDEDRVEEASALLKEFNERPEVLKEEAIQGPPPPPPPPVPTLEEAGQEPLHFKVKVHVRTRRPLSHPLNTFLILVCVVFYFWNSFQERKLINEKGALAVHLVMTSLQQALMFDDPLAMRPLDRLVKEYSLEGIKDLKDLPPPAQELIAQSESIPSWKGVVALILKFPKGGWKVVKETPLFEKIRQGQAWRLITPTFLHRDFLHILFNMAWLWILGAQIEERIPRWKMLLLIVIIGVVSNLAQYLMGGPFFLGFSGVVVGMAGFIWMRQKMAPWEGYPLNRPTEIFIFLFVLAMFLLEAATVTLQVIGVTELTAHIANTAHIVGGLTGILLARLSLFARKSTGKKR